MRLEWYGVVCCCFQILKHSCMSFRGTSLISPCPLSLFFCFDSVGIWIRQALCKPAWEEKNVGTFPISSQMLVQQKPSEDHVFPFSSFFSSAEGSWHMVKKLNFILLQNFRGWKPAQDWLTSAPLWSSQASCLANGPGKDLSRAKVMNWAEQEGQMARMDPLPYEIASGIHPTPPPAIYWWKLCVITSLGWGRFMSFRSPKKNTQCCKEESFTHWLGFHNAPPPFHVSPGPV